MKRRSVNFIDTFAGCGGLSLGLMKAGLKGLFAIERDRFAFETLSTNLVNRKASGIGFDWPDWLPCEPHDIDEMLNEYSSELRELRGHVDLLVGGPPCQGFSSAGKRQAFDPRNRLINSYLQLVEAVRPRAVLIENVRGITTDFKLGTTSNQSLNYSKLLIDALSENYEVHTCVINATDYGVPQNRIRFFLAAKLKNSNSSGLNPFEILTKQRSSFLRKKGLLNATGSSMAISDLEAAFAGKILSDDTPGYLAIGYSEPRTHYQRLMREGLSGQASNTRLAKHNEHIVKRFQYIISSCQKSGRLNTTIDNQLREQLGLRKRALRVLDPDLPSPTITSMPDDLLHYFEPRTLTVRENARLQSFPDWFEFKGKYTSGGNLRRKEVPRFTQVANAVPPLLAEAIGLALEEWLIIDQ